MNLEEKRKELAALLDRRSELYRQTYGTYDRSRTIDPVLREEYSRVNVEYYRLSGEITAEAARIARETKDAELLAQGKTRELANARIAEIVKEVETLLKEAEGHANDFDLQFQIETNNMSYPLDYDGTYNAYEGWDSSNC